MPDPTVPETSLFKKVVVDALIVAVVGYCISLSMAKLFGTKFDYKIDGNQEMLGEGLSYVFGAFFLCIPSAASMARSLVQVNVGGRTQLVSIFSASLMILVLLFIGQLFEPLPKACLAAIIIVALKGMFMQFKDLPKFWKKSKLDGLYWLGTFIATVLLDIDSGLAVGIILSIFMTYYHGLRFKVKEQGIIKPSVDVEGKDFDLADLDEQDREKQNVERIEGMMVIRIYGYFSFTNFEKILKQLNKLEDGRNQSDLKILIDSSELHKLDQTAGKRFVDWLNKNERRNIYAPNDQVWNMMLAFDLEESKQVKDLVKYLSSKDETDAKQNLFPEKTDEVQETVLTNPD